MKKIITTIIMITLFTASAIAWTNNFSVMTDPNTPDAEVWFSDDANTPDAEVWFSGDANTPDAEVWHYLF